MGTYELWHELMYGVGVFVACNAVGMALRRLFRRAAPIAAVRVGPVSPDELADALSALKKPAPDDWMPQTLRDMRRQYEPDAEAQQRDDASSDAVPTA